MEAELTFEQLYADLGAAHSETLPEQYFTIAQFGRDTGLSRYLANKRLEGYVEEGKMATRLAAVNGRSMRIWWFICN